MGSILLRLSFVVKHVILLARKDLECLVMLVVLPEEVLVNASDDFDHFDVLTLGARCLKEGFALVDVLHLVVLVDEVLEHRLILGVNQLGLDHVGAKFYA